METKTNITVEATVNAPVQSLSGDVTLCGTAISLNAFVSAGGTIRLDSGSTVTQNAAGFLSATANIAPAAHARMFELWEAGDLAGAREIHYGLHPLVDLLFVETNPAPGKWVLEQRGLIRSGYVRPPLITPTDAGLTKIRALMSEGEQYLSPVEGFVLS